jgi:hypothetical protein
MGTFTWYGLGEEGGALIKQCEADAAVLAPRGINAEFLTSLGTSITTMTGLSSDATIAVETKEGLTGEEKDWRVTVLNDCSKITDIVKITFKKGPVWKACHIGERQSKSTKVIVKRANDVLKTAKKYTTQLQANGMPQADIDTLEQDIAQLTAADSTQEKAKSSDAPAATAAGRDAAKNVRLLLDKIHANASAAFKGQPAKLKPYKAAKKLRYLPVPRKAKTTTTTTDAKAAAATAGTTEAKK